MALGANAVVEHTVDGVTITLTGTENGMTGFTRDIAHVATRKPGGGSQAEREVDSKEEFTGSFSIRSNANTRGAYVRAEPVVGTWNLYEDGKVSGKPSETWQAYTEFEFAAGEDDYCTIAVTMYATSAVTPGTVT